MERKRMRRGESFGRLGVDRTISNSLKSPSRQKQRFGGASQGKGEVTEEQPQGPQLTVRFTEETPQFHLCSNFDKDMPNKDYEQRKKELWYSREDFESFLKERVATIRLLQVVEGDVVALRMHCPDLCLRGLEPFQCNTLNQEMQCQRQWHLRVVLTEQTMQKTQASKDPERIRQLAQERSEWARVRAQQLASLDEMEAKGLHNNSSVQVRRRSMACAELGMAKLMLTQNQQQQQQQPLQRQLPKRRATLALATPSPGTAANLNPLGLSSTRRVPVDMAILKEWNAKFLADMRSKSQVSSSNTGTSSGDSADKTPNNAGASSTVTTLSSIMDIKSLSDKTAESRRALQGGSMLWQNPAAAIKSSSLGYGDASSSSSLATNTTPTFNTTDSNNKDIMSASNFRFNVRRDSLVGLRRESFIAGLNPHSYTDPAKGSCSAEVGDTTSSSAASINTDPARSGLNTLAEACFRFPVRRDSLSNVHWS